MNKTRNRLRDITKIKELSYENKRLKSENDQLRKRMARIDLDKYGQLKKTIKRHYKKEDAKQGNDILERVRKEWACKEEGCSGFLEIILFNKINSTFYYRKCTDCTNRTKSQRYSPEIKGIIKK